MKYNSVGNEFSEPNKYYHNSHSVYPIRESISSIPESESKLKDSSYSEKDLNQEVKKYMESSGFDYCVATEVSTAGLRDVNNYTDYDGSDISEKTAKQLYLHEKKAVLDEKIKMLKSFYAHHGDDPEYGAYGMSYNEMSRYVKKLEQQLKELEQE